MLQDRATIESVRIMKNHLMELFEKLYDSNKDSAILGSFCRDNLWKTEKERFRDYFFESFQCAATRYIQYEYNLKHMTYMQIIECSNFTPLAKPPLYQCIDKEGKILNT